MYRHFHRHDDRDSVETVHVGESPRSSSRSSCRKNKRRRVDQTGNAHNPDFIDLTDVTDQDEAASVRVLEEINHSPYLDSSIVLDANRFVVVLSVGRKHCYTKDFYSASIFPLICH